MSVTYKILSKFYDLIDVVYFKENGINPRKAIVDSIPDGEVQVLDVCTGTGSNGILIATQKPKAQVVGIDRSREMLAIADKKIETLRLHNMKTHFADATDTHLAAESFDVIVVALVLHEVSSELAAELLGEARRLLKPEGKLIVLEWEAPTALSKKMLFKIISTLEPKPFKAFMAVDKGTYFLSHGFALTDTKHCDYSCVYQLEKAPIKK